MRSEADEIVHSLARNSANASPNSCACGPASTRTTARSACSNTSRRSPVSRGGQKVELIAGLQRAREGAADAGARRHAQAAEHRLALNAAFDPKDAEDTAPCCADLQPLAVAERCRLVERQRAPADRDLARGAGERDTNRTVPRLKTCRERPDLDRRSVCRVADKGVGCGQRKQVHRAARGEAVALCAVAASVLHRGQRSGSDDGKCAHAVASSAIGSPASAARSSAAHSRWSMA